MFFKKSYNKGVEDGSRAHEEKYRTLNEARCESERKQEEINKQSRRLQGEMINDLEKHNKEINELFSLVGEKRNCGESGNAVFDQQNNGRIITDYTDNLLDRYNLLDFPKGFRTEPEIVENIAVILTEAVEIGMNAKFHDSLTKLEQCGMIEVEKYEKHMQSVRNAKMVTAASVYTAFSLAPVVYELVSDFARKSHIINFIIGSFGYINRQNTQMINYEITTMLGSSNIKIKEKKCNKLIAEYSTDKGLQKLYKYKGKTICTYGNDGLIAIGKQVISRCDLKDPQTNQRAKEYLCDILKIKYNDTEKLINSVKLSQESLSDIIMFAGINYQYYFNDMIKNISEAKKFAYYNLDNDPYKSIRDERKITMENIINQVSSSKNPFLTKGKRTDIIMGGADIARYSLNPQYDIDMDIKCIKKKSELLRSYDK